MNFFTYLDIEFQKAAIENQTKHSVRKEQKTKALYMVLQGYRWFHKWLAVPLILIDYLMVTMGFREFPISPLEKMKQEQTPKTDLTVVPNEETEPSTSKDLA